MMFSRFGVGRFFLVNFLYNFELLYQQFTIHPLWYKTNWVTCIYDTGDTRLYIERYDIFNSYDRWWLPSVPYRLWLPFLSFYFSHHTYMHDICFFHLYWHHHRRQLRFIADCVLLQSYSRVITKIRDSQKRNPIGTNNPGHK